MSSNQTVEGPTTLLFYAEIFYFLYLVACLLIMFLEMRTKPTSFVIHTGAVGLGLLSSFLSKRALTSDLIDKATGFLWYKFFLYDSFALTLFCIGGTIYGFFLRDRKNIVGGVVGMITGCLLIPLLPISYFACQSYGSYEAIAHAGQNGGAAGFAGRKDLLL